MIETKEEEKKLLEEFPGLQRFSNRMYTITELTRDAEQETDLAFMADSFKTVLRLQERLHAEILMWYSTEHTKQFNGMTKNCREWKAIAEKLEVALKQERQDNREMFDNLCAAFVVNPRKAFEMVLKFIERDEKCKCPDGFENWQWGLHFPLITRLRMAWKLVFGDKDIPQSSST